MISQDPNASIYGTSRQGTLEGITKNQLIKALGKPHETGGDKTTAEWYFQTGYGVATLYDYWWNSTNEWSIGAHNKQAADALHAYLTSLID